MSNSFGALARPSVSARHDAACDAHGRARCILLALALSFAAGAAFFATPYGAHLLQVSISEITR
ncbi:hypothetical protein [Aureimonas ureilytica]|uniref:hypothetical protein n=1 Tax=Aureimonas ureilytica TaxID=401562 RepID=UPI000AF6E382|nr:hypothetical protein [Aureimonas ureilytica]